MSTLIGKSSLPAGVRRLASARTIATSLACAVFATSCSVEPVSPMCSRHDVPSMGPENAFRVTVSEPSRIDAANEWIDLNLTIVPPIVSPVTLIHTVDAKEVERWVLHVTPGAAISTRCRLGATPAMSTCKATLAVPVSTGGEWSLDAGDNHVLEAGMAFRLCR